MPDGVPARRRLNPLPQAVRSPRGALRDSGEAPLLPGTPDRTSFVDPPAPSRAVEGTEASGGHPAAEVGDPERRAEDGDTPLPPETLTEEIRARELQAAFASSPIKAMKPRTSHSPATPTTVEVLLHSDNHVTPGSPRNAHTPRKTVAFASSHTDGEEVDAEPMGRGTPSSVIDDGDSMGHITIFMGTWNMNNLSSINTEFNSFLRPNPAQRASDASDAGPAQPMPTTASAQAEAAAAALETSATAQKNSGNDDGPHSHRSTGGSADTDGRASTRGSDSASDLADMYVIGTQECNIDRRAWQKKVLTALGDDYEVLCVQDLTPIKMSIYVRSSIRRYIESIETADIPTKLGGALKTKGAVGMSMKIAGGLFLFINSHLPAHQNAVADRNQAYKTICHGLPLPHKEHLEQAFQLISTPSRRARRRSVVDRFQYVFWMGDLNYRLDTTRAVVEACVEKGEIPGLWEYDQLRREMATGTDGVFNGFVEQDVHFAPTYKFDRGTSRYDSSEKRRVPAWTDRILYKEHDEGTIHCTRYDACHDLMESDHRPVYATFAVDIPQGQWCPRDMNDETAAAMHDMVKQARQTMVRDFTVAKAAVAPRKRSSFKVAKEKEKKPKSAVCVIA